jgi:hypothetical protein
MTMSSMEKTLQTATGVKPKGKEDRQIYLGRLLEAIAGLPGDKWEELSTEAQNWYNAAQTEVNEDRPVPEFPEDEAAAEQAPAAKPAAVKAKEKPAAPASAKTKQPEAAAKPNGGKKILTGGAQTLIKQAIIKNPAITTEEITEMLAKKGLRTSPLTVSTIRSDFKHSIRVLQDSGLVSGDTNFG